MRPFESIGNLDGDGNRKSNRHRTAGDLAVESISLQVGHRDEDPAVRHFDVIDRADVRMADDGARLRFMDEPAAAGPIEFAGVEKFQRHGTPEPRVFGLVHYSHAALSKASGDSVARDSIAGGHAFLITNAVTRKGQDGYYLQQP